MLCRHFFFLVCWSTSVITFLAFFPPSLYPPRISSGTFFECIFPVFLAIIQCNFLFINIWFPTSEVSSAQAAQSETGAGREEGTRKKARHYLSDSPFPLLIFNHFLSLFPLVVWHQCSSKCGPNLLDMTISLCQASLPSVAPSSEMLVCVFFYDI